MISLNQNDKIEYLSAGLFKSNGVWQHPRRIIDSFEIIFICEGIAYIGENGTEYTLKKNDLLLLEPEKEHYGFRASEDFVSFFWLHYRTTCDRYRALAKQLHAPNASALKTLFSQCLHVANTPTCSPVCAELYTGLILEEVFSQSKAASSVRNYLAAQIKEYILLHPEKNLSVKTLAEHFGYHENHISRIFKDTYGVLLRKYLTEQKITHAQALLHTTLYTVNQIAQQLSFKSENHFIKFFKYHTGVTPTEYRNAYTNRHVNKA